MHYAKLSVDTYSAGDNDLTALPFCSSSCAAVLAGVLTNCLRLANVDAFGALLKAAHEQGAEGRCAYCGTSIPAPVWPHNYAPVAATTVPK